MNTAGAVSPAPTFPVEEGDHVPGNKGIWVGIFCTVYYYLTLNHLVHVSWGLLGLAWVAVRTALGIYSARDFSGLEAAAMYWHATDVLWLVIFPFFYVFR